jgi:hypothetical protein
MTKAVIKEEFKHVQVAFNNSGLPLGMRDDIDVLAQIAIDGNDEYLKGLFEVLPQGKDLLESKGEEFLKEITPTPVVPPSTEAKLEGKEIGNNKK